MKAQIKLGRIFGVKIGLHYSWLIIALLVTLSLVGQFYVIAMGPKRDLGDGDHHGSAVIHDTLAPRVVPRGGSTIARPSSEIYYPVRAWRRGGDRERSD